MTRWWLASLSLIVCALVAVSASAHPLAPLGVRITERDGEIEVSLKRARVQPKGAVFAVRVPSSCEPIGAPTYEETDAYVLERRRFGCSRSIVGEAFGVDGLTEADVDAVLHVALADGRVLSALLDHSAERYAVPERVTRATLAGDFARAGVGHLFAGIDHLLFVVGLVLLLSRTRPVLFALTAFTVGHAVSLCAATLGWLTVPPRVAEVAIAASLVWLALSIAKSQKPRLPTGNGPTSRSAISSSSRQGRDGAERGWDAAIVRRPERVEGGLQRPYLAAAGMGLVHGLGFAAVFSSAGLGGTDLAVALGGFHVGIELGQLAVVLVALLVVRLTRSRWSTKRAEILSAYAIGSVATMWLIERVIRAVA